MRDFDSEVYHMIEMSPLPQQKEIMRQFDNDMKARQLSAWRRRGYFKVLKDLAIHVEKPFQNIDKHDLVSFFATMNKAASTIQLYKGVIKRFYKWLLGNEETYPDCVRWIKTGSYKRRLPTDESEKITGETVARIVEAASHPRDKALIMTLYESGARPHEILTLRIGNVSMDRYGAIIIVNGKTGMRRLRLIQSAPYLAIWITSTPLV